MGIYYLLEGEGILNLSGVEHPVCRGSSVFIPSDTEHGIRNTGRDKLRLLYVLAIDLFGEADYIFSEASKPATSRPAVERASMWRHVAHRVAGKLNGLTFQRRPISYCSGLPKKDDATRSQLEECISLYVSAGAAPGVTVRRAASGRERSRSCRQDLKWRA